MSHVCRLRFEKRVYTFVCSDEGVYICYDVAYIEGAHNIDADLIYDDEHLQ